MAPTVVVLPIFPLSWALQKSTSWLMLVTVLEVDVCESCQDHMADSWLGVTNRSVALVTGLLEFTVSSNPPDSSIESLGGFLWELLGLLEVDCVDGSVEHRHCQRLDPPHHLVLSVPVDLGTLIEGNILEVWRHRDPELIQ